MILYHFYFGVVLVLESVRGLKSKLKKKSNLPVDLQNLKKIFWRSLRGQFLGSQLKVNLQNIGTHSTITTQERGCILCCF